MEKTLLILAAWMGSRYWWLKQLDEFGKNGESILEYSIYDAINAWFTKVVFIIRKSFEEDFKKKFQGTFEDKIKVEYVFQDMIVHIDGKEYWDHREKPRGTGHAVLCAKDVINEPFAVINADDYYWQDSFVQISKYFDKDFDNKKSCMVWYVLKNTLSKHWIVNRGICDVKEWSLDNVVECIWIPYWEDWYVVDSTWNNINVNSIVSMNFWWFHPDIFNVLEKKFHNFVLNNLSDPKKEYYIPTLVDDLIKSGDMICDVLETKDSRCWVTNPDDKPIVQKAFDDFIKQEKYPLNLRK